MNNEDKEFELIQNDELVASASGFGAWDEIMSYAAQYGQDGPLGLYEVTRKLVDMRSLAAPAVANAAPVQMLGEDYIHTIASECGMYEQHDNAKPSADTVIGFADALYKAIMSNAAIHADASFEDAQSSAWGKYVKLWNGGQIAGEMPPKFKDMFRAGWQSAIAAQAPKAALTDAKIMAIVGANFSRSTNGNWLADTGEVKFFARAIEAAAAPNAGLVEALRDMLSGWRYIRASHGDLYGVGWDRAQSKAEAALAAAGFPSPPEA